MPQSDPRTGDVDDLLPDLGMAEVLRQRPSGITSAWHAVRVALAVTVSWVVADTVSQSSFALFAPITTLMVVQASLWTTIGLSVQRIVGTGLGVLLASVYVNLVGLTWWSFLFGVLGALLIARGLPLSLGGQLQIPLAVVFVLALGSGTITQDLWRVLDVLIGGAVGLLAVVAFPQRPRPEPFERALRVYRDAIVETVRAVGRESGARGAELGIDAPHDYVQPSRQLRERADAARDALVALAESSALNVRARAVREDLDARAIRLRRLSGIAVQVRGIVGAANRMYDRPGLEPGLSPQGLRELMSDLAVLMEAVLGTGDEAVGGGAVTTLADELDASLAARLRTTADDIAEHHSQVGDVLASVAVLGRLDHVRQQLADFPAWQA